MSARRYDFGPGYHALTDPEPGARPAGSKPPVPPPGRRPSPEEQARSREWSGTFPGSFTLEWQRSLSQRSTAIRVEFDEPSLLELTREADVRAVVERAAAIIAVELVHWWEREKEHG